MVPSIEFRALIVALELMRNAAQGAALAAIGNAANVTRFARGEGG